MHAALAGEVGCLLTLIAAGANLDATDDDNQTAHMHAVKNFKTHIASLLHAADLSVRERSAMEASAAEPSAAPKRALRM